MRLSLESLPTLRGQVAYGRVAVAEAPCGWELTDLAGRLVELSGEGDSAALSLAVGLVAAAHRQGGNAAWVTVTDPFFPPDAAAAGVDLAALAVVQLPEKLPPHPGQRSARGRCGAGGATAARAALHLLRAGCFALVVLDLGRVELEAAAATLLAHLARGHATALLCLTTKGEGDPSLSPLVSLRLHTRRTAAAAGVGPPPDRPHHAPGVEPSRCAAGGRTPRPPRGESPPSLLPAGGGLRPPPDPRGARRWPDGGERGAEERQPNLAEAVVGPWPGRRPGSGAGREPGSASAPVLRGLGVWRPAGGGDGGQAVAVRAVRLGKGSEKGLFEIAAEGRAAGTGGAQPRRLGLATAPPCKGAEGRGDRAPSSPAAAVALGGEPPGARLGVDSASVAAGASHPRQPCAGTRPGRPARSTPSAPRLARPSSAEGSTSGRAPAALGADPIRSPDADAEAGPFLCHLTALRDRRRGPGWRHVEPCGGPAGLC